MRKRRATRRAAVLLSLLLLVVMLSTMAGAQAASPIDTAVTTPRAFFGYDIGQDYKLTPWQAKTIPGEGLRQGIVEYAHELARTSDRVQVFEEGLTEEGRPMILTVITSKSNWDRMPELKGILKKLADPREIANDDEALYLAQQGKAVYWLSAAIHASERTSPEVLLQLGYDLASGNDDWTLNTLDKTVVVLENTINPDGLERVTDWYYKYKDTPYYSSNPPYYNKYISHDNNRDFLGMGIVETRNNVQARQEWQPTVYHDLHEAMDMLYMSPGNDPTNEAVNPLTSAEWLAFAGHNISQLTSAGWKGVFTYDYADMWYPGYNHGYSFMHNTNGRFYELQGVYKATPRTFTSLGRSKTWYNPAPYTVPFTLHLADAVHLEEEALKNDLTYTVNNKDQLLLNFYLKGKTNMQQATTQPPYAFVIPQGGGNNPNVVDMINNLHLLQKIEIDRAGVGFSAGGQQFQAGDYVVRMDQPYGLTAKNLLSTQTYPRVVQPDGTIKAPYDVTAWTYGLMRDVQVVPLSTTLPSGLSLIAVTDTIPYAGTLTGTPSRLYSIEHQANNNLAVLLPRLWSQSGFIVSQVDQPFSAVGHAFPAGTLLVRTDASAASHATLKTLVEELGLVAYATPRLYVPSTILAAPKLGLYTPNNSNTATMPEGWTRLRLDRAGWTYTRLFPADVITGTVDSLDGYKVIVIPSVATRTLINGSSTSTTTPPEYRPGIGDAGVAKLRHFVEQGGTLVLQGAVSTLPIEKSWGISVTVPSAAMLAAQGSQTLSDTGEEQDLPDFGGPQPPAAVQGQAVSQAVTLNCPGSILRLSVDPTTKVGYGYSSQEAVWCESSSPYFQVLSGSPASIVAGYPQDGTLLLSGYISGDTLLRGKAAIVDAPLGAGHVILLAPNVLYRAQTTGTYSFFWNSLLEGSRAGVAEWYYPLPIIGQGQAGGQP